MINVIAIFYIFNILTQCEAITYQTGYFDLRYNNGCAAPNTIIFPEPFGRIPQVLVFYVKYDFNPNSGPLFFYSGITKTQFVVTFNCIFPDGIYTITIQWIAVDDDRFEFISSFNNDVSNDLSKTFILPHSNPLHVQKFYGPINFNYGFLPTFDFNLDAQITTTDVIVTFTQTNLNVLTLGFYVVLGTADAFNLGAVTTLSDVSGWSWGHYTNLPILYNYHLIISYLSIAYQLPATIDTLRIHTQFQLNSNETISYFVTSWSACIVQSIKFQEIIIHTDNYIFKPSIFKKMRSAKKFDNNPDNYPIKLRISEIQNMILTNSQLFILDSSHQWSTMIFSIKCRLSTYVQAQITKCFGCLNMFLNIKQQCYKSINLMEFYVTLYQQDLVEQKFQLDITTAQITLTHLVQNTIGIVPYQLITISLNEV